MPTDDVLTIPTDAAARTALLRRLKALAAVDHPCVEPVRAAVESPDGRLVVPREAGSGTALSVVLAVRDRCDAAEAAGVAVAVARGLAALHSAGVVHGPLEAGDVVVAPDGRPRLRPRLDAAVGHVSEADDVHALARLVDAVVADPDADATVALRAALAPALSGDAGVRPEAGTLAARVDDAVPPGPVRLPEPAVLAAAELGRAGGSRSAQRVPVARHRPARRAGQERATTGSRRGRGRGRRSARRTGFARSAIAAAAVLVTTVVVVVVAVHVGGPEQHRPTASARPPAVASVHPGATTAEDGAQAATVTEREDPAGAAAELTLRRVELLAGARPLEEVVLAGSPAEEEAGVRLEQVRASRVEVDGARVTVLESRVHSSDGQAAEVSVRYVVEQHEQTADGRTTVVPADGPLTATLHLAWTDEGWRVAEVA
ncbi:hypothetical protein [Isoptericola halotolerans]|uniref:Protein kinase domain-containing protein n=1 Tax=Isoptericola halotolerans TaxID=300560 RepID=A0ABX2A8L0_9MICO|nr:hypothetical protein [Isoptericola halotolerans]NOV99109.1 hypothetical protein [Isoptericola halotolerans]